MTEQEPGHADAIAGQVSHRLSDSDTELVAGDRISESGVGDLVNPADAWDLETASEPRRNSFWFMVVCAWLMLIAFSAVLLLLLTLTLGLNGFPRRHLSSATVPFLLVSATVPLLAIMLLYRRRFRLTTILVGGLVPYIVLVVLGNGYQFVSALNTVHLQNDFHAMVIQVLAMQTALWLLLGVAYNSGEIRSHEKWLSFYRFSGEWFACVLVIELIIGVILYFLLGLLYSFGLGFTYLFGPDLDSGNTHWVGFVIIGAILLLMSMLPVTGIAAAGWFADARREAVGKVVGVLVKIAAPLITIVSAILLIGPLSSVSDPDWPFATSDAGEFWLLTAEAMLLLAVPIIIYMVASRDKLKKPGFSDYSLLALVGCSLGWALIAVWWILARIGAYGLSGDRAAALVLNIIFLVNLFGLLWLQARFLFGRIPVARLARWQTGFVWPYFTWGALVVLVVPPVISLT